jgi:ribokinase
LGIKIEIKDVVFTTGGGGTNTAVTFSRQGLKTACVGVVSNDFNGREILRELRKEKVKPIFIIHKDGFTAYSTILVMPNAERTILSYKGEGQYFNLQEVPWRKLKAKWFYFDSLGGNFDLLQKLTENAVSQNSKIAFNPGGKELAHGLEKLKPILDKIDIFISNKEEAELFLNLSNQNPPEDTVKKLSNFIKGIVIMTLGPDGVIVFDKKNIYKAGTPDSPKVERTGAGDAFGSGFVAQYIIQKEKLKVEDEKEIIVKAIQFATANASSVVSQYGPKAGILKKGDWGPWPLVEVKLENI